jgi:hypothetical protein
MTKRIAMVLIALALVIGGFSLMPQKVAHAGSYNAPVLLIHGFNAGSTINCDAGSELGDIESFFYQSYGYWNTQSLGFYNGDYNCSNYQGGESYHCTGWYDSGNNDGTVNEDIRHTTCLLAWFIWDQYTQYGTTIAVVAHSMGGILIRQAMNDTPYVGAFPPYLKISDVATLGAPHQGLMDGAAGFLSYFQGCPGNCVEVYQMQRSNAMMSNLNSTTVRGGFGRNPQGSGGTDWTTIASNGDEVLNDGCTVSSERKGAPGNVEIGTVCGFMPGATHFFAYAGATPEYCHTCSSSYLTDESTAWNADANYSDNNGGTWVTATADTTHSIQTVYYAILYSSW